MLILFDIHLPLPDDSRLSRMAEWVFTHLVALIDHPELTRFSSFPKSPIFMQFKSDFIQFSSEQAASERPDIPGRLFFP